MCSNNSGQCPYSSVNRRWVCSKTGGYSDWQCWPVLWHTLTQMKGWSLVRAVRRKASTSPWSGRKWFYLETEETFCSLALPYPGTASSSSQREDKGEICCFPQQDWTSLPVCFAFLRNSLWFIPCRLRSLLLSCQTYCKAGYCGLFPPPTFHRVNQEPMDSSFSRCSFLKRWSWDSSHLLKL